VTPVQEVMCPGLVPKDTKIRKHGMLFVYDYRLWHNYYIGK